MWKSETGTLELLLSYYEHCRKQQNLEEKSYRDFLYDLILCHEKQFSPNLGLFPNDVEDEEPQSPNASCGSPDNSPEDIQSNNECNSVWNIQSGRAESPDIVSHNASPENGGNQPQAEEIKEENEGEQGSSTSKECDTPAQISTPEKNGSPMDGREQIGGKESEKENGSRSKMAVEMAKIGKESRTSSRQKTTTSKKRNDVIDVETFFDLLDEAPSEGREGKSGSRKRRSSDSESSDLEMTKVVMKKKKIDSGKGVDRRMIAPRPGMTRDGRTIVTARPLNTVGSVSDQRDRRLMGRGPSYDTYDPTADIEMRIERRTVPTTPSIFVGKDGRMGLVPPEKFSINSISLAKPSVASSMAAISGMSSKGSKTAVEGVLPSSSKSSTKSLIDSIDKLMSTPNFESFASTPVNLGFGTAPGNSFPCILCSMTFSTEERYNSHSCFAQSSTFKCRYCPRELNSTERRRSHEKKHFQPPL